MKDKLIVRLARHSDIAAIADLSRRTYISAPYDYERSTRGQINNFPEGQFVADLGGKIVGHAPPSLSAVRLRSSPIAGTRSPVKVWPRGMIRSAIIFMAWAFASMATTGGCASGNAFTTRGAGFARNGA